MRQDKIDQDHLLMMTGNDVELAVEVLGIFRQQADTWGRLLDAGAEPDQWADACHTIKGAARGIGAEELAQACEAGETRGRTGDVSKTEAAVLISTVKDRLTETLEALAFVEHQLSSSAPLRASKDPNS